MTKSSMLLAAAVLAGTAGAFAPAPSARAATKLYEDAAAVEDAPFCRGYVGGEGPEPIPFAGIQQNSGNWDPLDFCGVS